MNSDIKQYGGCLPDKRDGRDYNALELMGDISVVKIPSFQEGYSLRRAYWPDMPYTNQGGTFACVAHAWTQYKELLQLKDTNEKTILSPKSIYNAIAIPGKGSYIRDGGMRTVNYGVNKEISVPTDSNELLITESFNFTPELIQEAAFYKNRIVASVDTQNFDILAKLIVMNDGIVSGWGSHAVWFDEYGVQNGKRYLKTPNSYGPGQDLYYFEDGPEKLFSIWTAVDVKNMKPKTDKLRLIRAKGEKTVWFLLNGKRYHVLNPGMMNDGLAEGIWGGFAEVEELSPEEVQMYLLIRIPLSDFLATRFAK